MRLPVGFCLHRFMDKRGRNRAVRQRKMNLNVGQCVSPAPFFWDGNPLGGAGEMRCPPLRMGGRAPFPVLSLSWSGRSEAGIF